MWREKYGAIWNPPCHEGEIVLSENYLADVDLVTLVVKRADGLLAAAVLKKAHDPQWRLPFWGSVEAPALVETLADAERYLEATLAVS